MWYDDAEINFFLTHNRRVRGIPRPELPNGIYTQAFNRDSLLRIEQDIYRLGNLQDTGAMGRLDSSIRTRLRRYTASDVAIVEADLESVVRQIVEEGGVRE